MAAEIIDGKKIAEEIKAELKTEIEFLKSKGITPGLAAVLVGDDPASALYVKMKSQTCQSVGIFSEIIKKDKSTTIDELIDLINALNDRKDIDGILVQAPLPSQIDEKVSDFRH